MRKMTAFLLLNALVVSAFAGGIPRALNDLVMRCLEKDPANRPQSAEALADALAGISTSDSWTQGHAQQWWDLHQS